MQIRPFALFAFLVGIALLVALLPGEAAHAELKSQPPASIAASPGTIVYVPGNSGPLDTGVPVHSDDLISIFAAGVISNGTMYFDPDGALIPHGGEDVILPDIASSSLVGSIGDFNMGFLLDDGADVNPSGVSGPELGYPGLFGPGYVGRSFKGVAMVDGNIYLAFNDYPLDDNAGSFQVSILVSPTGTITKSVDYPFAVRGMQRTHQIVISPERDIVSARLTDTLPSTVTWAGDISASSGGATYSDGSITWSGTLTTGLPVTIAYGVKVTHAPCCSVAAHTDVYTDVYNDAVLDDGQGHTFRSTSSVFAIGHPFGTGSDRTFDVAFGDADGDGHLDLAVGNYGQNQMCWNNGDGTFDCENAFGGSNTHDVKWGNMNKGEDDDLDLVVANFWNNTNRVFHNNGDHTFTSFDFSVCSGHDTSCSVDLGDVDNDGDLDIALGNQKAQDLIYYNDDVHGITFTRTVPTCYPGATEDLAFGDMDNDGDLDLVVVGASRDFVCLNDGTGHFTQTESLCWLADRVDIGTWRVALGDADGDGDLDVAAAEQGDYPNEVYLNSGDGCNFTTLVVGPAWERTWGLTWGNVDCDGDLDLVTANEYQQTVVYFNEPVTATNSITFTRRVFLNQGAHRAHGVALGDVNRDGYLDLAVGNNWEQNVIYINNLVSCVYCLPLLVRDYVP